MKKVISCVMSFLILGGLGLFYSGYMGFVDYSSKRDRNKQIQEQFFAEENGNNLNAEFLSKSCNEGNESSCHKLGVMLLQGKDNKNKAIGYLTRACDERLGDSCALLVEVYKGDKYGIPKNENKIFEFTEKTCRSFSSPECKKYSNELIDTYGEKGLKAVENFTRKQERDCDNGDLEQCYVLTFKYRYDGVENLENLENRKSPKEINEKLCHSGKYPQVCVELGNIDAFDNSYSDTMSRYSSLFDMQKTAYAYLGCQLDNVGFGCQVIAKDYMDGSGKKTDFYRAHKIMESVCNVAMERYDDNCKMYINWFAQWTNSDFDLKENEESCKKGDCRLLGIQYYFGLNVKENFKKAYKIFDTSCKKGDLESCLFMGDMYYFGRGVSTNYTKAKEFYEKASHKKNASIAAKLLKNEKLCDNGNSNACLKIGLQYLYDFNTLSEKYIKKACKMENPYACNIKSLLRI